jgi:hypothetical protein
VCNECWAVVRTVAAVELERTIHEMELSLNVATTDVRIAEPCISLPASSDLLAFVCDQCGHGVTLADHASRKCSLNRAEPLRTEFSVSILAERS